MLPLDQRHLPVAAGAMIADQASLGIEIGLVDRHQRLASNRPQTDPDHLAGPHRGSDQPGKRGRGGQHSLISNERRGIRLKTGALNGNLP